MSCFVPQIALRSAFSMGGSSPRARSPLEEQAEQAVRNRLTKGCTTVQNLQLTVIEDGQRVLVEGNAKSYYAKQLVTQALQEGIFTGFSVNNCVKVSEN